MPAVHIINHTHWDREWFLTEEYTTAWIPALIESLELRAQENPNYEYLFDGQTLVIEDLLRTEPAFRDRVETLVSKGTLSIGPLYSQPDWRMVSGESHMRNLRYGVGDAESLGGTADVAWLVDTFGHISQAPQMLRHAGVDAAYVWRGVPKMTPLFTWEGSDGTRIPTVDLFGGYRNLYGVTHTPEIAVDRLTAEVTKLQPSYGETPIPLFDGYDLDVNPEDPARYYEGLDVGAEVQLIASSPRKYADAVRPFFQDSPTIVGELLSGKFGSTFPGSLSSRAYLTVLHHDAETALYRRIEPLASLAAAAGRVDYDGETYERLSRTLLQNGVHDCICGVSIDQVHERMERSYRHVLSFADRHQIDLVSKLLDGFAPGTFAVSSLAMGGSGSVRIDGAVVDVAAPGIGISQTTPPAAVEPTMEPVDSFAHSNAYYSAEVNSSGLIVDGRAALRLFVVEDAGDTYSSEPRETLGELVLDGPIVVVDRSDLDQRVRYNLAWENETISVTATVTIRMTSAALVELSIDLDSTGTGFRIDAEIDTGVSADSVHASMPFDIVERAHEDTDLLAHQIDPGLAGILMGQREAGRVTEFPFHDFVAMSDGDRTSAVLAKGLRSYQSAQDGRITVTLRRSAEWLALTGLELRSGDAGPMMYVPMARCERLVSHEIGLVCLDGNLDSSGLLGVAEWFHNPPLVATVETGPEDGPTQWTVATIPLPLTSLVRGDAGETLARFWNPSNDAIELNSEIPLRSMREEDAGRTSSVRGRQIVTTSIAVPALDTGAGTASVAVRTPIVDRVGTNRSRPEASILNDLDARIDTFTADLDTVARAVDEATGNERWLALHRRYVVERELLELRLSRVLNERLAHSTTEVSIPDETDPVIASLGEELNELRVKRRIFDYVAQALAPGG